MLNLNIFKNHKTSDIQKNQESLKTPEHESTNLEKSPEANSENLNSQVSPELLHDSEGIDIRLEALNEYFKECEEKGIEMTPEMVKLEVRDKLGVEVEELLGKEIDDPEINESHTAMVKGIDDLMNQKATENKTPLSVLRDKVFGSKAAKVAFVSAMLLLKFNPAAAQNTEKKVFDKDHVKTSIDAKKVINPDGNDGKTFKTTAEDYENHSKKVIVKAGSNFDSGKAMLKDPKGVNTKFDKFLSEINKENFSSLMSQNWTVKGSSDETRNIQKGGNEKLTQDRIESLKVNLEKTLHSHDFSKQLSEDQVKKIVEKQFLEIYPKDGLEKGVTYINDLINPVTKVYFTDSEIKTIKDTNPAEYKNLLKACRYTNFELEIENNKMFNIDNYDEAALLCDDSGSMTNTRGGMAKSLDSLSVDKPLKLAYFSDRIDDAANSVANSKAAAKSILNSRNFGYGSQNEKALNSAIEYLNHFKPIVDAKKLNKEFSKRILYIATDEGLHDTGSILELERLAQEKHTDVEFLMFYDKGTKFIKVDLETLKEKVISSDGKILKHLNEFKDKDGKMITFGQ